MLNNRGNEKSGAIGRANNVLNTGELKNINKTFKKRNLCKLVPI